MALDMNMDRIRNLELADHPLGIGIIHPPPDIRSIVDKTARFVGRNGPEFEKRVIASNAGNARFSFLNYSDPYHAYYQRQLAEVRAQNQDPYHAYYQRQLAEVRAQNQAPN